MFAFIKGVLVAKEGDTLVVENNGIGYELMTAPELLDDFGSLNTEITAYTNFILRENSLAVYAFPGMAQVRAFKLLLTVSGVGPKLSAAILGTFAPEELALAILSSDIKKLTTVKGLGKKGAERLVLELKDKLAKLNTENPDLLHKLAGEGTCMPQEETYNDCMSALMVLGYPVGVCEQILKRSFNADLGLEENIREALKIVAN